MDEFLTSKQLTALEKVIKKARAKPGIHREPTPNGEALAYKYVNEIQWAVNGGPHDTNLARGVVPLKQP
jgi:hypothetical protein